MTKEKETIINGIDVSECDIRFNHFEKNICELGNRKLGELHYLCSENPNCHFKQLKRLQEENKELKKLKKYYKGFVANCRYCDEWYMDKCNYIKKENKYKQALEEIREKCLKMCNICDNIDGETYLDDCNSICEYCKIIDLINEALK